MNVSFSLFLFLHGRTCVCLSVCLSVCIYVCACLWREGGMERERLRQGGREERGPQGDRMHSRANIFLRARTLAGVFVH